MTDTPSGYVESAQIIPQTMLGPTCKLGHVFDEANTRVRANGTRLCRRCHREREAARIEKVRRRTGFLSKSMKIADMRAMRDRPGMTPELKDMLNRAITRLGGTP